MRPMLDDVELPQVQEVRTGHRRVLAEHRAPGMDGSVLQDLGRRATRIEVLGVASGPAAATVIAALRAKLAAATPVPFTADAVTDLALDSVMVDDLVVEELAGRPQRIAYTLTLREHLTPTDAGRASGVDADALDEASDLVGDLAGAFGSLGDAAKVIAGLEPFAGRLGDLFERLQKFRQDTERARNG